MESHELLFGHLLQVLIIFAAGFWMGCKFGEERLRTAIREDREEREAERAAEWLTK